MRLFYFSNVITILLCFALWLVFQVSAAMLCLNLPDKVFRPDAFFFRSHRWEQNGRVYDKIFLVKRWKHLLPDGGAVWKKKG
jgi:glycosyl-4,4'-diaponeurosporenoate acyltransferase